MFDLANQRICDHKIFDEKLTLQGSSPNYFGILKFQANGNTGAIEVREYSATEGLTNYRYTVNGFSNWSLSSDGRQINFNALGLGGPGTGIASFADGATLISPAPIYLASYQTISAQCPLHNQANSSSSPIQRDVNITEQGRFATVTGAEKVRQAVLKALLTFVGSNTFHPTYGALLANSVGQKFDLFTQFNLQQSIQDAVDFLIQQQQLEPAIPLDETIFRVSSIDLQLDPTDPRTIHVIIKILTGAYQEVPISFGVVT